MHIINVFLSFLLSIVTFIALFPLISSATTWDSAYIASFTKAYLESEIAPPDDGKIFFNIAEIDSRIIIKP